MHHLDDHRGFFEVRLSLLPPAEGGRGTPVTSGYMPNWWLPGAPERVLASAAIEILDADQLFPGSTATARVYPFTWAIWNGVAIGAELDVTEGPHRTIGKALVIRIVPSAIPAGQPSA
jgi:hypothetical protein